MVVWSGQLLSSVGTGAAAFALNLWILQGTGSLSHFALAFFFTALPGLLFAPFAGALVDRHNRHRILCASDAVSATLMAAMLVVFAIGRLTAELAYLGMALQSCTIALRWPAYQAYVRQVTSAEQLGRRTGMLQLADACSQIVAPALAGTLLSLLGLDWLLALVLLGYGWSLCTLLITPIPATPQGTAASSMLAECGQAVRYLQRRPDLLRLLFYFAGVNFVLGLVLVLSTPLILSFASAASMGLILSSSSVGMLVSGLVVAKGHSGEPLRTIFVFSLCAAASIGAAGLVPSPWWFTTAGFCFFFSVGMVNAHSQLLWLSSVDAELQGRVFSLRRIVALSSAPLAYLAAAPLGSLFTPLLQHGGPWVATAGLVFGTGPARGLALLFTVFGLFLLTLTLVCFLHPSLRRDGPVQAYS